MSRARPLVTLDRVDVTLSGARILRDVTLAVREREGLAILGPNGSGKSTLLRLLRGDLWPDARSAGERLFHGPEGAETSPIGARERFGLVAPEAQDAYVRRDWDLPVEAVIRSGFFDALWPADAATPAQSARVREVAEALGIAPLLGRSFLALSRGEGRRVLLARALAPGPQVLFLDEACDGLDRGSRAAFLELLSEVARAGTTLVAATHREAEIVPEIRRVARLLAGRVVEEGTREEVLRAGQSVVAASAGPPHPDPLPGWRGGEGGGAGGRQRGGAEGGVRPPGTKRVLFSLRAVDLLVGGRKVLDGVDWTMHAGERWAILGPNGAGKSTFLRLLAGEEHPSSGELERLGLGPRASVWDVKAHVSLVSAELQARHRSDATGEEVVLSGFAASIGLAVPPTARERASASRWIDRLGLSALAPRHIASLSYGELRKLLLARALVTDPEVLLLDEPVSGLDPVARAWMLDTLDRLARAGTALVLVTHHDDELVPAIDHVAVLEGGRLVRQGRR